MTEPARHMVQLLVSEWCTPCRAAEAVWQRVAERRDIIFEVLDMAQPEARAIAQRHSLRSVPAVVIDEKLMGVGVQTLEQALGLVADAPEKTATTLRFVGITLAHSSRWALIAAAVYLVIGSLPLVLEGSLFAGTIVSRALAHLFPAGFVLFAIFGLAEHMLPRFTGRPVRMGGLAALQQVLANIGIFSLLFGGLAGSRMVAIAGGSLLMLSLIAFSARMLPVIGEPLQANASDTGAPVRGTSSEVVAAEVSPGH